MNSAAPRPSGEGLFLMGIPPKLESTMRYDFQPDDVFDLDLMVDALIASIEE